MTFEKVKEIIVDTLSCEEDEVTMEANLFDDLGADSLDAVELNMAIGDAFGITIEDEKIAEMKTVGDIVNYIDSTK
ncbi:MAG: acyl carrier protein [Firmicutes bacterium]|nr:acyl carrier protein [Bacillota bacterium]